VSNEQKHDAGGRHSILDLSIHNAIVFASRKHAKQYRKGTDIPYIAH